ncbi:MAG: hypothetical protein NTZ80_03485, partial [Patescibacteria group bacterium]|nr:hypothetical protein [Patescibacteria group bacterium]
MANKEEDLKSRHIVTPVSISAKEYSSDNASGDENEINLGKSGADTEIRENVEMQSDQPISAEKNNMEIEQDLPQDENENKGIMASFRSLEGQKQKVGCLLLIAMVAIFAVIALIIVIQISNNRSTKTNVNVTPANAEVSEKQQADEAKVENLPNNQEIVSTQAEEQNTAVQQSTGTETGLKIMFGVFAFAAFLVLIFGGFMFFTSKDPLGKDKAKRIMIPASSALAILLVINGILFAYYSKKVPVQTYVDSPIAITYYSKSQTAAPLDVELDVSKLPEITNTRFISWNFGDGSKGSGAKVRHI